MFDNFFNGPANQEDMDYLPLMNMEEENDDGVEDQVIPDELPILPLKNTVLFPGVVIPITVGRDKSIQAVQTAYQNDRLIGVLSQVDPNVEDPSSKDLNNVGTIARIVKELKMPDGSTTVIIQGKKRVAVNKILGEDPYISANVEEQKDVDPSDEKEFNATISSLKELAGQIIESSPNIPTEANVVLSNIDSSSFLIHFISSNLNNEVAEKQSILETDDLGKRAQLVLEYLNQELQKLELQNKIQSKVKTDIEKQQRDYFLQQQLKTIQEELGGDSSDQEIQRLRERAKEKKWGKTVNETFYRELEKLERVNPAAAEYSVMINYLELLLDLPWGIYTKDKFDLQHARKILDRDHYGLEKVKERILEYLAVLKLKGDMKSPILCFVGPPGVGKTSLGKSIATALKRKYTRMSLGGLHDESEIRGHRKTYIGAMPGRIIQSIKKVESSNPVFMLDEIDKVGKDFRGDPSSALLEVLDPEQNSNFYDNYLELDYDLSRVMFIATANDVNSIQPTLRDRMEIIDINGYSVEEKTEIAKRHLVSKQREAHGLTGKDVKINNKVIQSVIEHYTRESGVRELDRQLASIMRTTAKKVATNEDYSVNIKKSDLHSILGAHKYDKSDYQEDNPPGVGVGLAWTSTGGDILYIETSLSRGKGELTLTGNLGDVMKESASTALTFVRSNSEKLNIQDELFNKLDVHLHVPEGAIPKDGPSAGIVLMTAIASAFTQRKVKKHLAMTGELTLRGKVLPVGGIKEKLLAARRAGITDIILCSKNRKDVEEINDEYLKGITVHYFDNMLDVLQYALEEKRTSHPLNVEVAELENADNNQ